MTPNQKRLIIVIGWVYGVGGLIFLAGGCVLLISYFTGYETYQECRVAMAQSQYDSGHHGEFCYQMWLSGRWDFKTPDDRDTAP